MSPDGLGSERLDERRQAFVVRIWQERRDVADGDPTWRGSVDDVRTGARTYFTTLGDLMDYLRRHTGMKLARAHLLLAPRPLRR
jgi:hypothetical protein